MVTKEATKEQRKHEPPAIVALAIDDGNWALVDAGGSRWFGRAFDRGFVAWLEATRGGSAYESIPPLDLALFPAYELMLHDDGGGQHQLAAIPHAMLGVGVPVLLTRTSLALVRDMRPGDVETFRKTIAAVEQLKTELRAKRSGIALR
jgi:hypothetical protein